MSPLYVALVTVLLVVGAGARDRLTSQRRFRYEHRQVPPRRPNIVFLITDDQDTELGKRKASIWVF